MAQSGGGPSIEELLLLLGGGYLLYSWYTGTGFFAPTATTTTPATTGTTTPVTTPTTTQTPTLPSGTGTPQQCQGGGCAAPAINSVEGYDASTGLYTSGTALQGTYLVVWGTFPASPAPAVAINGAIVPASSVVVTADNDAGAPGPTQINIDLAGLGQIGSNTVTVATTGSPASSAAGSVSAAFQITAPASSSGSGSGVSCSNSAWNTMANKLATMAASDPAMVNGKMTAWDWDWFVTTNMNGTATNGMSATEAAVMYDVCDYMALRAKYNQNTGLSGIDRMNTAVNFRRDGFGNLYPVPRR